MKEICVLICLILTISPAWAKRLHPEAEYQKVWCEKHKGTMEYVIKTKNQGSGRVDCLTDTLAVEVDFANKWAECIGQAIYYGRMTNRQAVCVLIMENGEKDLKYLKRLRHAAYRKGVNIRTFTMKPEHLCIPVNNKTK